uniref:SET domain-containing protein n=1 Tax=Chromera velia CCMP2878 TaxID=1169474 RepID=A0A0G4HKA9_9ALVE|eukprot:Cvel_1107.t1-p1 / transcript=Cvel_1107.t1 / gene=Cvel_1107 / organism=Chromera_velia_CCMP2878 / gene_product=Histone-lysine N-methyltransferase SETMAR, putative / transcript_product=Histone-lysine N-methyltransferase SETMAR, putative / location=Cvel_scaffold36:69508-77110(+) / protein_length=1374 / sequence_SO=supercontig / SO=protein_coding / is_pseudo=false
MGGENQNSNAPPARATTARQAAVQAKRAAAEQSQTNGRPLSELGGQVPAVSSASASSGAQISNEITDRLKKAIQEGDGATIFRLLNDKYCEYLTTVTTTKAASEVRKWLMLARIDHDSVIPKKIGHPPFPIPLGSRFLFKTHLSVMGLHSQEMCGIANHPEVGAQAIVMNGGYDDDDDLGDRFIYCGMGKSDQQSLTAGNKALMDSWQRGLPVRVLRGYKGHSQFAPSWGFRYDGLYVIAEMFMDTSGEEGVGRVWKCLFKKVPPQANLKRLTGVSDEGRKDIDEAEMERLVEWGKGPIVVPEGGTSASLVFACPNQTDPFDGQALTQMPRKQEEEEELGEGVEDPYVITHEPFGHTGEAAKGLPENFSGGSNEAVKKKVTEIVANQQKEWLKTQSKLRGLDSKNKKPNNKVSSKRVVPFTFTLPTADLSNVQRPQPPVPLGGADGNPKPPIRKTRLTRNGLQNGWGREEKPEGEGGKAEGAAAAAAAVAETDGSAAQPMDVDAEGNGPTEAEGGPSSSSSSSSASASASEHVSDFVHIGDLTTFNDLFSALRQKNTELSAHPRHTASRHWVEEVCVEADALHEEMKTGDFDASDREQGHRVAKASFFPFWMSVVVFRKSQKIHRKLAVPRSFGERACISFFPQSATHVRDGVWVRAVLGFPFDGKWNPWEDLSMGSEKYPLKVINEVDNCPPPLDFGYTGEDVFFAFLPGIAYEATCGGCNFDETYEAYRQKKEEEERLERAQAEMKRQKEEQERERERENELGVKKEAATDVSEGAAAACSRQESPGVGGRETGGDRPQRSRSVSPSSLLPRVPAAAAASASANGAAASRDTQNTCRAECGGKVKLEPAASEDKHECVEEAKEGGGFPVCRGKNIQFALETRKGSNIFSCSDACGCDPRVCKNRKYKPGLQFRLAVQKTVNMGWELISQEFIPKGTVVCDYAGELISHGEGTARSLRCQFSGDTNYVLDQVGGEDGKDDWMYPAVDSHTFGNAARFTGHSHRPNLEVLTMWTLTTGTWKKGGGRGGQGQKAAASAKEGGGSKPKTQQQSQKKKGPKKGVKRVKEEEEGKAPEEEEDDDEVKAVAIEIPIPLDEDGNEINPPAAAAAAAAALGPLGPQPKKRKREVKPEKEAGEGGVAASASASASSSAAGEGGVVRSRGGRAGQKRGASGQMNSAEVIDVESDEGPPADGQKPKESSAGGGASASASARSRGGGGKRRRGGVKVRVGSPPPAPVKSPQIASASVLKQMIEKQKAEADKEKEKKEPDGSETVSVVWEGEGEEDPDPAGDAEDMRAVAEERGLEGIVHIAFRTLREIHPGEPIRWDYGRRYATDEHAIKCACGESNCPGVIGLPPIDEEAVEGLKAEPEDPPEA